MSCWVKKKDSRGQDKDKKDRELLPCSFISGSLGVAASTATVQFYAQSVCGLLLTDFLYLDVCSLSSQ